MGNSFEVKINNCKSICGELDSVCQQMERCKEELPMIISRLNIAMSYRLPQEKLRVGKGKLEKETYSCKNLKIALNNILILYQQTENKLLNDINVGSSKDAEGQTTEKKSWWESFWDWLCGILGWNDAPVEDYEIDSIVFDDEGSYGGDQGAPKREWGDDSDKADLYSIVRNYYPDMTDKEISDYLTKLNSEGCGYVALINTVFAAYEGKADEFKETFGFDMYNSDGDLNYNRLLVDLYAATDNHNAGEGGADVISFSEDKSSTEGHGTSQSSREYRLELYLKEKGADVNFDNNVDVTTGNFKEYSEDKYVIMSFHNGNLYNADGTVAQYIDGGHAMVVTGTTEDGRFVVSSWGKKYYIDPNENIGGNTWLAFQTVEYSNI